MASYTRLDLHVVFSTKYRRPTIHERFREELYQYLGGILRAERCTLHEVGGMPDHVHLLLGMPATVALSDVIRTLKANSSKWLNERADVYEPFRWQGGYAAFTVSVSQFETIRAYIQNQPEHHKQRSFKEELLKLLERHQVAYVLEQVFEEEPDSERG